MKKIWIVIALIVLVMAAIYGLWFWQLKHQLARRESTRPAPTAVTVARSKTIMWQPRISSAGQLLATRGVTIKAQGHGVVMKLPMVSGQEVSANQLLVVLAHDDLGAVLRSRQAALQLTQSDYQRYLQLAAQQNVSKQLLETKKTEWQQAKSALDQAQAAYDYQFIRAPFACRLGLAQVHLGQFVAVGDPVVNCENIHFLTLNFSVPQQFFSVLKVGQTIDINVDAYAAHTFHGQLVAIEPKVSETTRSINVEARLNNQLGKMLPGMFVTVHTPVGSKKAVVVVPQTAVHPTLYGDYVYVVQPGKPTTTVKQTQVKLGDVVGSNVIITQGLTAGVSVVSLGQATLRDGAAVNVTASPSGYRP